jgi:transposase-like protein
MELVYYSKDVAKQLNIAPGTLRKWSIALEARGYEFTKDENARRAYKERDIVELLNLKQQLLQQKNMKNAVNTVISRGEDTSRTLPVPQKNEEIMRSYERSQVQFFNTVIEQLKNVSEELAATKKDNRELREMLEMIISQQQGLFIRTIKRLFK